MLLLGLLLNKDPGGHLISVMKYVETGGILDTMIAMMET